MRIERGRFGLAVKEQPANDRQPLAERERPRGEAVTEARKERGSVESGFEARRNEAHVCVERGAQFEGSGFAGEIP